jgi:predicted nucleotidyltransferase
MRSPKRKTFSTSASAIYLDRDAARAEIRRIVVEAARRDPRIVRVLLFGSLVRGTPTPRSDIDLIVVLREAPPRRMDRVPALLEAFGSSPLPLDLHPYTVAEWEASANDPLCELARREGEDLLEGDIDGAGRAG